MPPLQVLSPGLAGQGAGLAAPAGSGLRARAAAGSAWAAPAAPERGAHVAQAPAWPTVVMKDQGEWVEKPYCLYLFQGAGHRLPIWQANKPTFKAATSFFPGSLPPPLLHSRKRLPIATSWAALAILLGPGNGFKLKF